jgi:membrane associated rhomboid family serine protease
MGIFLLRHPREDIECWVPFLGKVNVPAALFILGFFAFDVIAYRAAEVGVNYVAHFTGFAAGALFKLLFWDTFTTEKIEAPKRAPPGARFSSARTPRR